MFRLIYSESSISLTADISRYFLLGEINLGDKIGICGKRDELPTFQVYKDSRCHLKTNTLYPTSCANLHLSNLNALI